MADHQDAQDIAPTIAEPTEAAAAPPQYPAKPSAAYQPPKAETPARDASAPVSSRHADGDEDISDTDEEEPDVTDKQRSQLGAMYKAAGQAGGSAAAAGAGPKDDDSGTDTDDDGALIQKAKQDIKEKIAQQASGPKSKGGGGSRARPGSGITLKMLVEEGMLTPGVGVLSVEYKGSVTVADLLEDGRIWWKGQTFESPSAFSIHVKRLVNPSRKADDGWKTVKYERKYLESFKVALAKQKLDGGDSSVGPIPEPRPQKRQRVVGTPDLADPSKARNGGVANGGPADRAPVRRRAAPPASLGDEHTMATLQQYSFPAGSGERNSQPFTLQVSAAAEVMMDFHSHLSSNQVIGVLAGYVDPANHIVRVMHAMPVKEVPAENNRISVEMDAEDEHRARAMIEKLNMRCVGWYHSHPTFAATPSLIDVYNQVMQQQAHRDNTLLPYEAYVGAIVGPYDKGQTGTTSALTWFTVEHPPGVFPTYNDNPLDLDCRPYQLKTHPVYGMDSDIVVLLQRSFPELAKRYARMRSGRPDMQEEWHNGITRLQKLKASIRSRLPDGWQPETCDEYVDKVQQAVMAAWTMFQPAGAGVGGGVGGAAPAGPPAAAGGVTMVPQVPASLPGMVPQAVAHTMVPQHPPAGPTMVPQGPPPGMVPQQPPAGPTMVPQPPPPGGQF